MFSLQYDIGNYISKITVAYFGHHIFFQSDLVSQFCAISFQEYVSKGITHPVFYGDLVYKLTRVKD